MYLLVTFNSLPPEKLFILFCRLLFFFKINFFEKFFQEYYLRVKQIGSRSGPTFCQAWSGSNLFAKVISRQHSEVKHSELPKIHLVSFSSSWEDWENQHTCPPKNDLSSLTHSLLAANFVVCWVPLQTVYYKCFWYTKEPFHCCSYFEYPQHMLCLRNSLINFQ